MPSLPSVDTRSQLATMTRHPPNTQGHAVGNILPKLVIVAVVAVPVAVLFSINSTGQVLTEHFGPQTLKADPSGQLSTSSDLQIQGTNVLLAIGAAAAFAFSPLGGPFVRGVEVLIDVIDTEYESRFEFFEDDEEFDDEPEDIEPIGEEPVKPKPKPRLSLDEQVVDSRDA